MLPKPELIDLLNLKTSKGKNLHDLSFHIPVLLIFLRHFGCIFCREAMIDISEKKEYFREIGVQLVLVHMSESELAEKYFHKYGLSEYDSISDPDCKVYLDFGLAKGNFNQLFGLKVMLRGFESSVLKGNSFSIRQIGDGFQMPGVFLLKDGEIKSSYIHQSVSDKPDYDDLINCCLS